MIFVLILRGPRPAAQEALAELTRVFTLDCSGELFSRKLTGIVTNAKVKSVALRLDWWEGPGDARVGDPARAEKGGFVFEISHGGDFVALPPAARGLDLTARAAAPEGTFAGQPVAGPWAVRQKTGGEPVRRVEVEVVYLVPAGKGIAQPDLLVAAIRFTDLEPDPVPEGKYPLRRDYPSLAAGKDHAARVLLANKGYGDAREPDVTLWLEPVEGKGRTNLPPAKVDVTLREGEEMGVKWTLPVPAKLAPGLYWLHALVDPKGRVNEMNEENNEYARLVRLVAGG